MTLALFFVAYTLVIATHVGAMALTGWRLGATVEEVSLFCSPVLIRLQHRGVQFKLGLIPCGGYVRFKGDREQPKDMDEILFAADMEPPGFNDLHPIKRAAIHASGCVALIAVAACCLGPLASVRSLGRGFVQFMPFAPWTPAWVPSGKVLAGRLVALIREGPFLLLLGVLAAKLAAANLLPLPTLNGGMITLCLLGGKRGLPEKVVTAATYVGLCMVLPAMLYWILCIAAVLLGFR
jgi:membrane-associated protease RseP (regulator of RpoE activity)